MGKGCATSSPAGVAPEEITFLGGIMFGEVQAAHRLMRRSALFFGNCNRNAGEETQLEKI